MDMMGSIASLDDGVQTVDEGVNRMQIVDEEVLRFDDGADRRTKWL